MDCYSGGSTDRGSGGVSSGSPWAETSVPGRSAPPTIALGSQVVNVRMTPNALTEASWTYPGFRAPCYRPLDVTALPKPFDGAVHHDASDLHHVAGARIWRLDVPVDKSGA